MHCSISITAHCFHNRSFCKLSNLSSPYWKGSQTVQQWLRQHYDSEYLRYTFYPHCMDWHPLWPMETWMDGCNPVSWLAYVILKATWLVESLWFPAQVGLVFWSWIFFRPFIIYCEREQIQISEKRELNSWTWVEMCQEQALTSDKNMWKNKIKVFGQKVGFYYIKLFIKISTRGVTKSVKISDISRYMGSEWKFPVECWKKWQIKQTKTRSTRVSREWSRLSRPAL